MQLSVGQRQLLAQTVLGLHAKILFLATFSFDLSPIPKEQFSFFSNGLTEE